MRYNSRIIVFGHQTTIGKNLIKILKKNNYKNIFVCNFSSQNIQSYNNIKNIFNEKRPNYVFLVDGESGGINFNQKYPASLMVSNLNSCLNIFPLAHKFKVKKLLYLASSCIYPKDVDHPLKPKIIMSNFLEPTNISYATAKIAGMELCNAYNAQYGTKFITAIPSDYFGPENNFNSENSHVIPALIAKIHNAKINNKKNVKIWGSGKPIRDFIYIDDLASAMIFVMKNYRSKYPINITSCNYLSIKEIANMIKKIIGFEGRLQYDTLKPDGMLIKTLDNSSISKLGWKSSFTFNKALKYTYKLYKKTLL